MAKYCPQCNCELPDESSFCLQCFSYVGNQSLPSKTLQKKKFVIKNKKAFSSAIIAFSFVFLLVVSVLCAYQINKNKINTSTPETITSLVAVTDINGETVTDENGENIYEVIEIEVTTEKLNLIDKILGITEKNTETVIAIENNSTITSTNSDQTINNTQQDTSSSQIDQVESESASANTNDPTTEATEVTESVLTFTASKAEDFEWDVYNEKARLVKYKGNANAVTVPAKHNGLDVAYMADGAFSDNANIKIIKFDSSDTPFVIQEKWSSKPVYFKNLPNLTTVIFPNKSIGQKGPFNDNFSTIFSNCPAIASISFDGRTESSSTYFCSIDGVPYFAGYLSYYPVGKKTATYNVPSICKEFNQKALRNNPYLVTVNLNKNTTGNYIYDNFDGCSSLKAINVPADTVSKNMRSIDGVLYVDGCSLSDTYGYNNEKMTYVCYPAGKTDETFHFATGKKLYFQSNSLGGNKYLKTVYLPEGSRCTTTWTKNTNLKTVYLKDCEDSHRIAKDSSFLGKTVLYY